jgi:integrase
MPIARSTEARAMALAKKAFEWHHKIPPKIILDDRAPPRLRTLGCTAGLRDGEIAGLQWQDADLDAPVPVLQVRKAVPMMGEERPDGERGKTTGPTKTQGSVRDVPIHPECLKALKAWKAAGWVEWTGRRPKPHDFVLPNEAGEAWRPRSAEAIREWLRAAECDDKYGGKPIDFHAVRRSFATWLARAGVERAVRKMLMGHVEGDVTEEHYIERDLAMLREAVCRIRLDLAPEGKVMFPGAKASEA